MYRVYIKTGKAGLTEQYIWSKFPRLVPFTHDDNSVTYTCKLDMNLLPEQRSIMDGFVEEGDILSYTCEPEEKLDTKYPRVNFRLGAQLEQELSQRSSRGESLDSIAKRDLDRYYDMLKRSLPAFSVGEAMLLCDVLNGTINQPYSVFLLWASVSDGVDEGRAEYWKQYHPELDGAKLIAKLKGLTPFECMAVADAIERAWNSETYQVANMEEKVRQVGLVREDKQQ